MPVNSMTTPYTPPPSADQVQISRQPRVLIIGGGPCGLGAAIRLQELGYTNWALYEQTQTWGGLAASFRDNEGFLWDIGGHVVFSHYQYFDDACAKLGPPVYNHIKRKCVLFMEEGKAVINYPLQNHIHQLPRGVQLHCLQGLLEAYWTNLTKKEDKVTESTKNLNFAQWGSKVLGRGIVDVFLRPYNQKLWSWPLEDMGAGWLGERVAVPDFNAVINKFATGECDVSWGPNSEFKFPAEGGTGAIWKHVGSRLNSKRARLGLGVTTIDAATKSVTLADGSVDTYDVIINTAPLPVLATDMLMIPEADQAQLNQLISQLKYSHTVVIGIGVRGRRPVVLDDFCWSYFPQDDAPMYRVTAFSNYSDAVCPPGEYYSLLCEVGFSDWKKRTESLEEVGDRVETALRKYKLIDDKVTIVSRSVREFHYGYPTPSVERDGLLEGIHSILTKYDIMSRGRFGGWKYEAGNMDHSLMQGVEAIDAILSMSTQLTLPFRHQLTYFQTNTVNDPKQRSQIPLTNVKDHFEAPSMKPPNKPHDIKEGTLTV
eukprot:Protomagalhaensia_sp_Gyna_25__814@NODE_1392_length_1880_cov_259_225964_g1121_i0_p1_GENE_NODE_1392_length_1880_cov_259_225964_g1121_i0NODE_1392_length_1880_cov_259_225964_g1121_i0_p1_ORF_typecomplete_len542_score57_41Amino_oxidase/PF01593_24/8_1e31NAD_binding_8/PF13450_6/2_5e11Pyr_redox_2/PF07992_14/9_8e05Pyr_redox_2/PF07992_14/7_5DAO/PF01266_24/4_1e06Pyr_redox_3/PF13738_6/3e05Thi4/PF01946_17/3_9e05FAD_binding_2/PF00890_24/7_7e05FAD_binding_3/PF01494_19/0_00037FAD_oxidored/PF12831_7/0_00054AlaDh_